MFSTAFFHISYSYFLDFFQLSCRKDLIKKVKYLHYNYYSTVMIDRKTREKIIKLWKDGESKTSIKKKTGKSFPTIRKVIREAGLDEGRGKKVPTVEDELLEERVKKLEEEIERIKQSVESGNKKEKADPFLDIPAVDTFVINLERNWPYRTNPPFQILRNGLPIWDLPRILGMVFPQSTANRIVRKVEELGGRGEIYEVQITHNLRGDPDIKVQALST